MEYLLAISVGPVQDFIAAARRTADLTAGSQLLSQIAGEIARFLQQEYGAELIFPAEASDTQPNKLLCLVKSEPGANGNRESMPEEMACQAKEHAQQFLRQRWDECVRQIQQQLSEFEQYLDKELAYHQLSNFLEFYAAWVPLESEADYPVARQQVELLLAGRKSLRDFKQPPLCPKRPKSPLDPAHDSVFKQHGSGFSVPEPLRHKPPLYLKARETLDTVSILKRVSGCQELQQTRGVPSTGDIALRAIWSLAQQKTPDKTCRLEFLRREYKAAGISDLFYPSRWHVLKEEQGIEVDATQLKERRHAIMRAVDVPDENLNYYAILIADGDRMGQHIHALQTKEAHRRFSRQLLQFARQAREIVGLHDGYLVYSGGDDVLALLPPNRVLCCAKQLAEAFKQKLNEIGIEAALSVGVAIVHYLDNLQVALERAREAEQFAKGIRNALAVARYPRSGDCTAARTHWNNYSLWIEAVAAFRNGLPNSLPYDWLSLVREYRNINISSDALRGEAMRVYLQKARDAVKTFTLPRFIQTVDDLREYCNLLLIARFLAGYPEEAER